MRRPVFSKRRGLWWLALALLMVMLLPGLAMAETKTVTQPNQSLYPDANFAGTPVAQVPQGSVVTVLQQSGDWYQVSYQGQNGWMNQAAFPAPSTGSKFGGLSGLLFGAPVQQTSSDEAALAGKGFSPEVESTYRSKHPEMKYGEVDQVEANRVDPAKLLAFIKQGGLKP